MTPILFTQPIPSQTDLAREITRDGEMTAPDSNAEKNDTFDTLLAEELSAVQSPVQQSGVVIQTAVLPSPATPTEENLIPGNVSAGTDPVPGLPDFALQESILSLPKGNQSTQYHDPVSGEAGISQKLPPNNESSAVPSLSKADVRPIVEHEESLKLSSTSSLGAASDSKLTILSPLQQESGAAREGVARAVTTHQIVQAEKPPLAFSVVQNPLRAEINPQPSAQQPVGPFSPGPFSKEEIGAQGEGVPLAPLPEQSGAAREGVALAVTTHQIVQAEKPPLAFSVVQNPLRAEINPQPSAQQPAGPFSPGPFSKEEIGAQGEGVPLAPLPEQSGTAREGVARAVTSHQIVQAEKPPLAFSVVQNPLRAEINPQPSAQQPAGPFSPGTFSPGPFSKEEIGAQGEGVPLAPTVVRRETEPSYSGMAHAEEGPGHDATFLSPPPAEGRRGIRTLSQTPQVLQGVTSEKGEKGSVGKDKVKSVEMEKSGSDDGNRAEALRSNDQRQAPEKQRVAVSSDKPSDSAPEKTPENPQERQQLAGDEMKNPSGSLKTSERTTVASVVNLSRSVPTEPRALPPSASLDAHESMLISPRDARALMEQVKQALSLQMREQTTEVRIRLQPESLGTMVVSVQQDEAKVAAEIRVEHSAVKAAIDTQLPNLRQALQSQGIDFQRLEVVVADQSMGREFFHQAQPSQKRRARNSSLHATEAHEPFTPRSLGYNTLELLF
jgi:hypothetical protein